MLAKVILGLAMRLPQRTVVLTSLSQRRRQLVTVSGQAKVGLQRLHAFALNGVSWGTSGRGAVLCGENVHSAKGRLPLWAGFVSPTFHVEHRLGLFV